MALIRVEPNSSGQQEMLNCLDIIRQKVADGDVRALLIVILPTDPHGIVRLEKPGDLRYAEAVGYLEFMKMSLWEDSVSG